MNLEQFEQLVLTRRSTRHFKPDTVPDALLARVLQAARWAPSGYNLQPTHIMVVRETALRTALRPACMDQPQIVEAPVVLIFTGDRQVRASNFERVLEMERAAGTISPEYERLLRRYVPLAFDHGPAGLGWLWKATLGPVARLLRPVPSFPAFEKKFWLAKQVMLSAMVTMLAATAAGLATVPMEGFDAGRVRAVLRIPRQFEIMLVMPLGYAADGPRAKTRLPLESIVHYESW